MVKSWAELQRVLKTGVNVTLVKAEFINGSLESLWEDTKHRGLNKTRKIKSVSNSLIVFEPDSRLVIESAKCIIPTESGFIYDSTSLDSWGCKLTYKIEIEG